MTSSSDKDQKRVTTYCCVNQCSNYERKGLSFHLFPADKNLRKKWEAILQIGKPSSRFIRVCSEHFQHSDYFPVLGTAKRRRLKKNVLPSQKLPVKKHDKQVMPKDKVVNRTHGRRAASKEALKQMQHILGDEKCITMSSDDDDVAIVDVQPPKKKYKLSHRKSIDDRDVIVLKKVKHGECLLVLDCEPEEISQCQKARREKINKEATQISLKIEKIISADKAQLIHVGEHSTMVEIEREFHNLMTTVPLSQNTQPQNIVIQQPATTTTPNTNVNPQSYQLVMDPRSGIIVGAVTTPNSSQAPPLQLIQTSMPVPTTTAKTSDSNKAKTKRGTILRQIPPSAITTQMKAAVQNKMAANANKLQLKPLKMKPLHTNKKALPPKPVIPARGRPPYNNAIPNMPPLTKIAQRPIVDLTADDKAADTHEIVVGKLQATTYPSLVVVARPHLRVKDLNCDRAKLDVKVKSVLMYPPTKFTEWLIQQGLVKADQKCKKHPLNSMKLGMFSDASKFPHSGGYVWISECCTSDFAQVFDGSIFENCPHPPMTILKLIYHWCCQTVIHNVTQWVKVDNIFVKTIFTYLRAVCTVANHSHIKQLGGAGVKVQVGLISLGTSQNQNQKQVKVEVLGVMETTTKHIRLKAIKPLPEFERNYKKRFCNILESMVSWVHPASVIVTDMTVDKNTLYNMGFINIIQSTSSDSHNSNGAVMEYLRRVVPRMFQNTLAHLSHPIIQQFLDELVWREWFGTTVLQAFDNLILHLSQQTRYESAQCLLTRLGSVSVDPFKNWAISVPGNIANINDQSALKRYNRSRKQQIPIESGVRPAKSTSPDVPEQMVPLENYYCGTLNIFKDSKRKFTLNIKCPFCKIGFADNLSLMDHLFKHAHNVTDSAILCRYCLALVITERDLQKHVASCHPDETKFDNCFVCLICENRFMNPHFLGKHMSKEHSPSELPYMCGTCSFRCSNHKQIIDHFYKQHDFGTTLQCPFCLKSTTIHSGSRNVTQNMNFFVQHLQKHQKNIAKKCFKCNLWFIQKEILKDHQLNMHSSLRGKAGLVPNLAPRNGVMVPKSKLDKYPDDGKSINFSTLHFTVGKNLMCKECNKVLNTFKHFGAFENCPNTNCQYSTCCGNAMRDHLIKNCKLVNAHMPPEKLPYELFCVCGYRSLDGNLMAKHLAICERKSAYPSVVAAEEAVVTHSMLDVLGLVRRPEEKTSEASEEVPREDEKREEEICVDDASQAVNKENEETDSLLTINKIDENPQILM